MWSVLFGLAPLPDERYGRTILSKYNEKLTKQQAQLSSAQVFVSCSGTCVVFVMIDLHLHSSHSDGTLRPDELVGMARQKAIQVISITDHDTISATEAALSAGIQAGVTVVPGLEISVELNDHSFHLLGYCFDHHNEALLKGLEKLQNARAERNRKIIEHLQKLGIAIEHSELERLSNHGQTGRPHIAQLLVAKGVVRSIDEAFANYLKKGRCAYVSRFVYQVDQAISMIHTAGGLSVLAHPLNVSSSMANLEAIIGPLKEIGLDGLETYYPTQRGSVKKQLQLLARRYGLVETGGSDYHGAIRPGTSMADGSVLQVPVAIWYNLREAHQRFLNARA